MTLTDKIAMGSGIAMLAIALVVFIIRLMRVRAGAAGQKKRVSAALRRFAAPRGYRVIDGARFIMGPLTGWADHLLIGVFGVLLVYDLSIQGEYYGKPADEKWTVAASGGKRWAVGNPLLEAGKCEGRVRTLLKDAGIKIPVERAVVIACPLKGSVSHIPSEDVMLLHKLGNYLGKEKFETDRGIDVEKVDQVLSAAKK